MGFGDGFGDELGRGAAQLVIIVGILFLLARGCS